MDERALSRRPRLPLLLAIVLLYSCPSAGASSVGEIAAEIVWNLIGAISRIRHGPDTDWADQGRQSGSLLTDPDFLYATFYRFASQDLKLFQFETSSGTGPHKDFDNSVLGSIENVVCYAFLDFFFVPVEIERTKTSGFQILGAVMEENARRRRRLWRPVSIVTCSGCWISWKSSTAFVVSDKVIIFSHFLARLFFFFFSLLSFFSPRAYIYIFVNGYWRPPRIYTTGDLHLSVCLSRKRVVAVQKEAASRDDEDEE